MSRLNWTHLAILLEDHTARILRARAVARNIVCGDEGNDLYVPSLMDELGGLSNSADKVEREVRKLRAHPSEWDNPPATKTTS